MSDRRIEEEIARTLRSADRPDVPKHLPMLRKYEDMAAALTPLLNRVRAEALREFRIGFGRRFALQDPYGHFDQMTMSAMHRQVEGLLDAEIARIEQNSEGNGSE